MTIRRLAGPLPLHKTAPAPQQKSTNTRTRCEKTKKKMPMERSMSCAERGVACYARPAPGTDLRCYSASYAVSYAPVAAGGGNKVQRAGSTGSSSSAWSRAPAVQRSGSTRSVAGGLNLRSYSASYAASYRPFADGKVKPGSATWSSVGSRSVNLRGYTPSFSALVYDVGAVPVPGKNPLEADAELQRKKRLVAYKVYDVEGKLKVSVRRSVKWIKAKYSRAVYGFW